MDAEKIFKKHYDNTFTTACSENTLASYQWIINAMNEAAQEALDENPNEEIEFLTKELQEAREEYQKLHELFRQTNERNAGDKLQLQKEIAELKEKTEYLNPSENNKWKFIEHSYAIADTGDYDGCLELTNGKISIFTQDDLEKEAGDMLINLLGSINVDFYLNDAAEFENHVLRTIEIPALQSSLQSEKEENKRLREGIENFKEWIGSYFSHYISRNAAHLLKMKSEQLLSEERKGENSYNS